MTDTSSVKFKQATFRDGQWPITLEDAIRYTGGYGGAHVYDFEAEIDDSFANLDDWTDGDAVGSIDTGRLKIAAGASARFYIVYHDVQVPPSFVASFDHSSGNGAFFFKKNASDLRAWGAWWNTTNCGFNRLANDGSPTNIINMPRGVTGPSRIQVYVRYSLDSVDDDRKWLEASLFVDGECYAEFAYDIGGTGYDWTGNQVGFGAYQNQTLYIDNFRISEMHRSVEWTVVDMGASPGSGMSRAIGTTRARYMCRYDNTIRVWRPKNRDLDWSVPNARGARIEMLTDTTDIPTHVRVQAAIHEADAFDDTGGEVWGQRFILWNDPNVMTEAEAELEARRVLHDHKERRKIIRVTLPPNYLLEPYDRVTIDGENYRIISLSLETSISERGEPAITQVIDAQQYLEFV